MKLILIIGLFTILEGSAYAKAFRFKLERNEQGQMSSLNIPTGEVVSYSFDPELTLSISSEELYLSDTPNQTWDPVVFPTYTIRSDDELTDTDGNYLLSFYSPRAGNFIKRQIFENNEVIFEWELVYFAYDPGAEFFETDYNFEEEPSGQVIYFFLVFIVFLVLLIMTLAILRRRLYEDQLTPEKIEEINDYFRERLYDLLDH